MNIFTVLHQVKVSDLQGRRLAAMAKLLVVVCVLAYLASRHPSRDGVIPPCPLREWAHLYCPGCGSLRATHYVLQGEIVAAWRHNPAMILLGVPALTWQVTNLLLGVAGRNPLPLRPPTSLIWAIGVSLIMYFIARNLPWPVFDGLRPPPEWPSTR